MLSNSIRSSFFVLLFFTFSAMAAGPGILTIPSIPSVPEIVSSGDTVYVSQTGDNSTGTGLISSPYKTVGKGLNQLSAGDTLIIVGSSTPYAEWNTLSTSGTSTDWITIKGEEDAQGNRPQLNIRFTIEADYIKYTGIDFGVTANTTNSENNRKIVIKTGSDHLVFDDVNIDCEKSESNNSAVWVESGVSDVWFQNMELEQCGYIKDENPPVTDCAGICIKHNQPSLGMIDNIVINNVSSNYHMGDGFGGRKNVKRVYVVDSVARENSGDGFDLGGELVVMKHNVAANNGLNPEGYSHQGTGFKLWAEVSWLTASLSYNNKNPGVLYRPYGDGWLYVLGNTLAGNAKGKYAAQVQSKNTHQDSSANAYIYLWNNIFHVVNTKAVMIEGSNHSVAGEGYNHYFQNNDSSLSRDYETKALEFRTEDGNGGYTVVDNYSYTDMADPTGDWQTDTIWGEGNIGTTDTLSGDEDPGFTDLANDDYRLDSSSEAVDAGVAVGISNDLDGVIIPQGAGPDIGVFEYIP